MEKIAFEFEEDADQVCIESMLGYLTKEKHFQHDMHSIWDFV